MIQSTLAFFPLLLTPSAVVPAHVQSPRTELPQSIQAQLPTGSWPGDRAVGPVGVTSLQLLSLIADGHGMTRGKWKDTVQKGAGWLLSQQDPTTGCIGCSDPSALKIERALLDHAWATYALSELAYFEKDSPWEAGEAASELAARALLDAQQGRGGFGTARATGWAAFALVAARDSGQPIDVARIVAALDALQRKVSVDGDPAHLDGGKVALRCLIGFMVQDATEAQSIDYAAIAAMANLTKVPDLWETLDPESRVLVAFASYQCGGETWERASTGIKNAVLPNQVRKGERRGRFLPERGFGEDRATALGVLAICAYFRYWRILGLR